MDDMVVGLVTTGFDKGGLEQVVFNLYKNYRDAGVKAYILCQDGNAMGSFADKLYDVRDFCIFEDSVEVFLAYCYRKRITHLHYHHNTCFIEQARECGIQTIYTIHNAYTWFDDVAMNRWCAMVDKCDSIVAVSSFAKDYFCARSDIRPDRVQVIPNGIDLLELDSPSVLPQRLTKAGLGLGEGDLVFAQAASFSPYKHQIGLIGVMEQVIRKDPRVKLLLVGNVLDDEYHAAFLNALNTSPAKDHIITINYFDHKYMGGFLRQTVDIAVLATLQEGCSNYVLEAMACKTPMILTKVGNAEDIKDAAVLVEEPAFSEIGTLSIEKIMKLSLQKKGKNTDALAQAFLYAAQHLDELKGAASRRDAHVLTSQHMTQAYLDVLGGLRPCFG